MASPGDVALFSRRDWGQYRDRSAARRDAVRRYHPDIGGSAEEIIAALAAIDARFISRHHSPDDPITVVGRGGAARRAKLRLRVWWRRCTRRRCARRYITL